ncbi:MAG TPA: histidine kinase [Gemmatimonadaceae bacterium]|nr:histidine kinase [Gemmatimonadaceae bacterium]
MNSGDLTALVHLVGFTTGIILYAMLGVMTQRRLSYVVAPNDRQAADRLPLAAAGLGVIWNVGAMIVFAARDFGIAYPMTWMAAVAYTALGFLPAVVVQSTLRRRNTRTFRWYLGIAYTASAVAGAMHVIAAAHGETPSPTGLLLLTMTYAGLLGVHAITERRRPGFQRSITAVALAAFAVSALHLSLHAGTTDQDPWWMELIGHHASLPLVLAILYQDHRFAFADLFLKRALSLLALIAVVSVLYVSVAAPLVDPHAIAARRQLDDGSHLFSTGALLGLWIATALLYPFVQRRIYRFVERVILRRADYREFRVDLSQRLARARNADEALGVTCELLAHALGAKAADWTPSSATQTGHPTIALDARRTEARIGIPTALAPSYEIRLADLGGGRSLLSDDLMLIDAVAASLGRRIDEVRLDAERRASEERENDMRRLATEAELRALRSQLNPHFLFNALNTLGHLMQVAPDRALATLYQLTNLLRAVLRRTTGQFVALREEMEIVESYLAIEHERFQERLVVTIDVPPQLLHARIPPLLLQPLVENAVKHGIAPMRVGGELTIRASHDATLDDADGFLRILVIDTGAGTSEHTVATREGVGLSNIESRLRHYFGAAAAVSIRPTPGGGTTVEVCVPWIVATEARPLTAV